MNYIIGGRNTGKTTRMLKWLVEAPEGEHRVIVSHTSEEAMRLLRLARQQNLPVESWQFVGPTEVEGAWPMVLAGRGGHISLGLDNLDMIIGYFLHTPHRFGMASLNLPEDATVHMTDKFTKSPFVPRESVEMYVSHMIDCAIGSQGQGDRCTCGLSLVFADREKH